MDDEKSGSRPQNWAFLRMDDEKSGSRPQNWAFLRMDGEKSGSRPQNWAFLRMDGEKSGSRPQNWAFLRMDDENPPVCSSLILVDYLAVLSLGKVDSVYKLHLIFVDLRSLSLFLVYYPVLSLSAVDFLGPYTSKS